ncbi:MAG TPA: DUF935 family protein, partial [Myxococcota bacterium]|nr:DUF935 family protein [Myxococcota bacterium]
MSIWTSLRDLFVGGPPLIPQAEPERWQPWRPQAPNSQAPGLTVGRIAAALREADEGFPARFCELMEDMEDRDPVLVSDLATRKAAVVGRPWAMEPSGDGRRARKVADFVRDHLLSIENLEDGLL